MLADGFQYTVVVVTAVTEAEKMSMTPPCTVTMFFKVGRPAGRVLKEYALGLCVESVRKGVTSEVVYAYE